MLVGDLRSDEWDPLARPAMRTFGAPKETGIVFKIHKNPDGSPIDYALARNGGHFKETFLRGKHNRW